MWMISNFRGNFADLGLICRYLVMALVFASCSSYAEGTSVAPDSPRSAPATTDKRPSTIDTSALAGPLELVSVRVRPLDKTLERMAGPIFLKQSTEPLAIEIQTQRPLPKTPLSTSAIVILNGQQIQDTWAVLPDKLIVFVPDRGKLEELNTVRAMWLGNEEATMTRRPLKFRLQDVMGK